MKLLIFLAMLLLNQSFAIGNSKPQNISKLEYNCKLRLQDALHHISTYHIVKKNNEDEVSGFHTCSAVPHAKFKGGTLFKVSPELWVYTNQSINDFYVGYIIYKGRVLPETKTFYPYTWSLYDIAQIICEKYKKKAKNKLSYIEEDNFRHRIIKSIVPLTKVAALITIIEQPKQRYLKPKVITAYPRRVNNKQPLKADLKMLALKQTRELNLIRTINAIVKRTEAFFRKRKKRSWDKKPRLY